MTINRSVSPQHKLKILATPLSSVHNVIHVPIPVIIPQGHHYTTYRQHAELPEGPPTAIVRVSSGGSSLTCRYPGLDRDGAHMGKYG